LGRLYSWFFNAINGFLKIIVRLEKFFFRKRCRPVAAKQKGRSEDRPFPTEPDGSDVKASAYHIMSMPPVQRA
jgi:hypothetical protein